jgi:hypothetical protein
MSDDLVDGMNIFNPIECNILPQDFKVGFAWFIGMYDALRANPAGQEDGGASVMASTFDDNIAGPDQVVPDKPHFNPIRISAVEVIPEFRIRIPYREKKINSFNMFPDDIGFGKLFEMDV